MAGTPVDDDSTDTEGTEDENEDDPEGTENEDDTEVTENEDENDDEDENENEDECTESNIPPFIEAQLGNTTVVLKTNCDPLMSDLYAILMVAFNLLYNQQAM